MEPLSRVSAWARGVDGRAEGVHDGLLLLVQGHGEGLPGLVDGLGAILDGAGLVDGRLGLLGAGDGDGGGGGQEGVRELDQFLGLGGKGYGEEGIHQNASSPPAAAGTVISCAYPLAFTSSRNGRPSMAMRRAEMSKVSPAAGSGSPATMCRRSMVWPA